MKSRTALILWAAAVAAVLAVVVLAGVTAATAHTGVAHRTYEPPAHTIVEVEGDKANGFGVFYYDGTSIFPPTDSEALAECGEYDLRVDRVRCGTEVRIWYRDLGDLKRALRYARSQ